MSAFSQYQNAQAQKKAAQMNAAAQDRAALENLKAGQAESDKKRKQGAAHLASQKAAMAANGADVTGTDSLDILDDTKGMIETDAFSIRENYRQRAQGNAQQAANYRAEAASAASNSFWAPVSTVLTGAAKVGSKYADWAV